MSSWDDNHADVPESPPRENAAVQHETPNTGIGAGKQKRMIQQWTEAEKEVTAGDISNSEKLQWLLSKLYIESKDQEKLISGLREMIEEGGEEPSQTLDRWKGGICIIALERQAPSPSSKYAEDSTMRTS